MLQVDKPKHEADRKARRSDRKKKAAATPAEAPVQTAAEAPVAAA